jgi:hypothetical protein
MQAFVPPASVYCFLVDVQRFYLKSKVKLKFLKRIERVKPSILFQLWEVNVFKYKFPGTKTKKKQKRFFTVYAIS